MTLIPSKYLTDSHIWLKRKEAAECMGMAYETFRRKWNAGKIKGLAMHPASGKIHRDSVISFIKDGMEASQRRRVGVSA